MPIISRTQLLPHSSSLACLSYDCVMAVQNDFRRAVSKQVTGDSVVVPTNIKSCVFVRNVVSELDESGRYEFHGAAMTLTSHLTHDKIREDPPPLKLGCEVSCGGHHWPRGKTTTGSALDGAVFDIAQILAYLVHNMSRSQLYLVFGHCGWLPSFFGQ